MYRWEAMPDLRRAELIDGIVYMSSPVSNHHDGCHIVVSTWPGIYAMGTPGCLPSLERTWKTGEGNVPQTDGMFRSACLALSKPQQYVRSLPFAGFP